MRGEEQEMGSIWTKIAEIPPHARRRGIRLLLAQRIPGNTSACAEKSGRRRWRSPKFGKYLRMRGEERFEVDPSAQTVEIPPHARRRECERQPATINEGNTSACAEKSYRGAWEVARWWKYLRMRGEEEDAWLSFIQFEEIPPHARRRDGLGGYSKLEAGNTSACAEKRQCTRRQMPPGWKYLRMRGEESSSTGALFSAGRVFRPRG